jgi:hypothetical protein
MENKDLPVYELDVDNENQMVAVALVDKPAIEVNWHAFREATPYNFKVADAERRIVMGAIMIPDKNIPRLTDDGKPYMVRFTKRAVERAVQQFMAAGRTKSVNLMHNSTDVPEGVFIYEVFIQDSERGIQHPKGFETLPEGTAYASMKIENNEVWADVKAGKFQGFSIEGSFVERKVDEVTEQEAIKMMLKIADMIKHSSKG